MRSIRSAGRRSPAGIDDGRRGDPLRRLRVVLGAFVVGVASLALAAPGAGASGSAQGPPGEPTTAPFEQCPAIGLDSTCEYLIDVKSKTEIKIKQDNTQTFYDGGDDVTVGIQNDSASPISSIHLGVNGSGDFIFGLDGDGLCSEGIAPKPEGCPFGPPGNFESPFDYYGPDTVLTADAGSFDSGTLAFNTELQPGQYTYFTLEAPPTGTAVSAGEVNDVVSTELRNTKTGELGAAITAPAPVGVTDTATIKGLKAEKANGKITYRVYSDPNCTKEVKEAGGTKTVVGGIAGPSNEVGTGLATNATYYWVATYAGDTEGNSPAESPCGAETMTFGTPIPPPQPSITTVLAGGGQAGTHITVPEGIAVTDTVVITPPGGQPVSGKVSYAVYNNAACIGKPITGVGGGGRTTGTGPSTNAVTLAVGTYYFQAFYSGNGVLNRAATPCGAEVLTVVAKAPPPPNSQFTSVGRPQINERNGQITVVGQFPAKGTATANGVVQQGATLARVERLIAEAARGKSKKCKRGFVKKRKKCVSNAPVLYGVSSITIPTPGTYAIVIKPTPRVLKALKAGKRLNVTVSTTFQNAAGGLPVTHVQSVFAKIKKKKPKKHKKH
jgi:hypothetical protein